MINPNDIPRPLSNEEVRELNFLTKHINRAKSLIGYINESDANRHNFERIRELNMRMYERRDFVTGHFSAN